MATTKDPVCGMDVKSDKAAGKSQHKGETFYFCSTGCREKFEKNPDQFSQKTKPSGKKS